MFAFNYLLNFKNRLQVRSLFERVELWFVFSSQFAIAVDWCEPGKVQLQGHDGKFQRGIASRQRQDNFMLPILVMHTSAQLK